MPDLKITLDEHPAREDVHGTLVPMFPEQKMIRINGIHAGYLSLVSGGVSMCRRYPQVVLAEVTRFAAAQLKELGKEHLVEALRVSQPPDPEKVEELKRRMQ